MTKSKSHVLLWKPRDGGAREPLLGWMRFDWRQDQLRFVSTGLPRPLGPLAAAALGGAIAAARDVTIAQTVEDPRHDPERSATALLVAFMQVRPVTLILPERPPWPGDREQRWAVAWVTGDASRAQPQTVRETAIQATVDVLAKEQFPAYAPSLYSVPNLVLRHNTSAEQLGIVPQQKVTGDMILALVAEDEDVMAAGARWDRATPETHAALVRARAAAQARMGIAEEDQVLLYSGDVEGILMPVLMRMGRGDEEETLALLRQRFRALYAEFGERVLRFALRTYPHGNVEGLRRAAGIAA